jgi:hypothetical protein
MAGAAYELGPSEEQASENAIHIRTSAHHLRSHDLMLNYFVFFPFPH